MSFWHLWDELIEKRNNKLIASDWTQMPDSPLSAEKKAEWATYSRPCVIFRSNGQLM